MKMKTNELTSTSLDWAVAKALHLNITKVAGVVYVNRKMFLPSIYWEQGGPILEQEGISVSFSVAPVSHPMGPWRAVPLGGRASAHGNTPLIAAMRCFVASKLGDDVALPDELV